MLLAVALIIAVHGGSFVLGYPPARWHCGRCVLVCAVLLECCCVGANVTVLRLQQFGRARAPESAAVLLHDTTDITTWDRVFKANPLTTVDHIAFRGAQMQRLRAIAMVSGNCLCEQGCLLFRFITVYMVIRLLKMQQPILCAISVVTYYASWETLANTVQGVQNAGACVSYMSCY